MNPTTAPLNEYAARAVATRTRRAPRAKAARKLLKDAIERSTALGQAARQAQAGK